MIESANSAAFWLNLTNVALGSATITLVVWIGWTVVKEVFSRRHR